jgi:hypothetical protein
MQLARVELQEALRALYTAHSALGVSKPVIYAKRPGLRGIKHLNVTLPECLTYRKKSWDIFIRTDQILARV